nr:S-layer homology domain-containing protein [Sedimentibacter sp.]
MKFKSKLVTISTVTVLTLSIAGQCFATAIPFTDIENVSAKDKINELRDKGYVNGVADGIFAPDKTVTAAESIQLFVNAFNLNLDTVRFIKEPKATDYFINAADDAWYANALIIATINGIELNNDIDLNQEWTREEFTYHLIQTIEKHGNLPMINIVPTEIKDQDKLTVSYDGAIQRALVYGIVQLDAEGKLNPKEKITRAEATEQIYNALKYIDAHQAPTEN